MFGFGKKCEHPFKSLAVYSKETVEPSDKFHEHVTYHLFCRKCGAGHLERYGTEGALSIKYARSLMTHDEAIKEHTKDILAERQAEENENN